MRRQPPIRIAVFLFLAMVCVGGLIALSSWDGIVYVYVGENRTPAAIDKVFDFSNLKGSELQVASQKRLLADARIIESDNAIGVELGHFVTRGSDGHKRFACQVFDSISLEFQAEGMAVGGRSPTMQVQGPCEMADNINRIEALWLPVSRILGEKPGEVELQFFERQNISVKFEHIKDRWPGQWALTSIRLTSSKTSEEVYISQKEILQYSHKPLAFEWPADEY